MTHDLPQIDDLITVFSIMLDHYFHDYIVSDYWGTFLGDTSTRIATIFGHIV